MLDTPYMSPLLIIRHKKTAFSFNKNNPPPKIQTHKKKELRSKRMGHRISSVKDKNT
jgi:hypothetical protein